VSCGEGGVCDVPQVQYRKQKRFSGDIPETLRRLRFVVYGADKVPIDPKTGRAASVTRPETWGSFEDALHFVDTNRRALGPGLILRPEDRVVCIDLDDVIHPVDGVKDYAEALVERFSTFTEQSMSGKGLHLYFTVREPPDFPGGRFIWRTSGGAHKVEVYHGVPGRYIAATGRRWRWNGAGNDLEERTQELSHFVSECVPLDLPPRQNQDERRVNTTAMLELFMELGVELPRRGRGLTWCPFHDDVERGGRSLSIDPARGWYDHGSCKTGGGAGRLREIVRDLSDEQLKAVSRRTGTPETKLIAIRERLRREQGSYRKERP
jgi:hypothetical protein